jgi:DNA-binding transcriptional LysR family regulator
MTPSFTDLTYFYEIAKQQNLSRAAKSLRVTQPSLSMAINRLEKSFDTPLFIRHHKGVTLTQSGERLLLHVSDLIARWHKTANSIDMLSEEVNGKVSIGCHASVGAT